jgi:NDP-sugar pyrophosphorylase family protein
MKVIILAGGKGTRLAPFTTVFPKPLVPLGDMPILDILVHQLEHYGFRDITLSLGYLSELIEAYFSEEVLKERKVKMSFLKERKPLGTVGAIGLVPDLKETFMTLNGDTLTTLDFRKVVEFHKKSGATLTIAMKNRDVKIELGVLEHDKDGRIRKLIEKPTYHFDVGTGIYIYEPKVLKYITPGQYLDFPTLVETLLQAGEPIIGYPMTEYWLDLGTHLDYQKAQSEFESLRKEILPGVGE